MNNSMSSQNSTFSSVESILNRSNSSGFCSPQSTSSEERTIRFMHGGILNSPLLHSYSNCLDLDTDKRISTDDSFKGGMNLYTF